MGWVVHALPVTPEPSRQGGVRRTRQVRLKGSPARAETVRRSGVAAVKARLRIDEDGGVAVDGRIDPRHHGRSFALLSSPAGLLLGVDDPRELPGDHGVVLAGDLAKIAFPEIVSLIVHGRHSGVLRVY